MFNRQGFSFYWNNFVYKKSHNIHEVGISAGLGGGVKMQFGDRDKKE